MSRRQYAAVCFTCDALVGFDTAAERDRYLKPHQLKGHRAETADEATALLTI